jgi:hypothetical protein
MKRFPSVSDYISNNPVRWIKDELYGKKDQYILISSRLSIFV